MDSNHQLLKKVGLKLTRARLKILELLQSPHCNHMSAESIYKKLLSTHQRIGIATVYRVLNQFTESGIMIRHNFESDKAVFELAKNDHDHLICLDCGKVMEFQDPYFEMRQAAIAQEHAITLTNRNIYLYGRCTAVKNCPSHKMSSSGEFNINTSSPRTKKEVF